MAKWWQLAIAVPEAEAEWLSDYLLLMGADAITLQNASEKPIYEPLPQTTPLWEQTWVTGLFPTEDNLNAVLAHLQQQITCIDYRISPLEDQNWTMVWKEHFKPQQYGKLWICPSYEIIDDPDSTVIVLDPGLAFGTGNHATTALCLEWLADAFDPSETSSLQETHPSLRGAKRRGNPASELNQHPSWIASSQKAAPRNDGTHIDGTGNDGLGPTVLDYGCGSGILAIAAAKLGASEVYAVDYDEQALAATLDNAKRNHVFNNKFHILAPKDVPQLSVDILVANILANPLIELAPMLTDYVKPQGYLILSGILESQITDVTQNYLANFSFSPPIIRNGWCRIVGKKQ